MGWRPRVGELLYGFIPKDKVRLVCRAAGLLFRDYGDRFDRGMARLKVVVERRGLHACREIVEAFLDEEDVDRSDFVTEFVEDCGDPVPPRPLADPAPVGSDGSAIARIMVPRGELDFRSLKRIAELSEEYGDKYLYTTNRQNFEIKGVEPAKLPALQDEIAALGMGSGCLADIDPFRTR